MLLHLCETQYALQLPVFFFSFFCQPYLGLRNWKSVLLILKISHAGTSAWFDSNEINQTRAGDVITLRSRDKLKSLHLHYHSTYDHQTWQADDLP